MDVPYDPACPLLIDSGDESLVSDDENIEKRYGDLLSKKMDGYHIGEKKTVLGKEHQSEARFVPAFEDDNEELLNYCLRESGILTDDEDEVKSDFAKELDNLSDVGNKHDAEMPSKEKIDLKVVAKSSEGESTGVEGFTESDRKYSKKKKKKHKLKEKHDESRGRRDSSSETIKENKYRKDSSKKDKKDKRYTKVIDGKKRGKKIETKTPTSSSSDDLDDGELFATLGENDDTFPLSKLGHDLDIEIESNQKRSRDLSKRNGKEKHQREQSKSKHRKEKVVDIKEEKKSKKKRQRSRSNHRRSKSSESDVPEKRRKRKRKHRDSSSEKDKKRNEKKKSVHEKKKKYEYENKDERDEKDKKKRRHHDKDNEKKPAHHKREKKMKRDSEKLTEKSHSHYEASHINKNKVEKANNHRSKSKETRKKELKQKEELTKHETIQKGHHKEHKKKQSESVDSKRKSIEEVGKDEKKHSTLNSVIGKSYVHNDAIQTLSEEDPDIEVLHKKEGNEDESISVQDHAENSGTKETDEVTLLADTDSEFEKAGSLDRELEKESSNSNVSLQDIIRTDDTADIDEAIQVDVDIKQSDESPKLSEGTIENSNVYGEEHDSSAEISKTESNEENEVVIASPTCSKPSSTSSLPQEVVDTSVMQRSKEIEKRPFKLFSQEETNKLHQELLSKEEQSEKMEKEGIVEEQSDSLDKMKNDLEEEVVIKGEESLTTAGNELQNDNEISRSDEVNSSEPKFAQKSKDDLFDDIFVQEDNDDKKDNDIAKMYEVDSTSPKMMSFKKQKSVIDQNAVVADTNETNIAPQVSEATTLRLEDSTAAEQNSESPEGGSPQGSAIPGLEPVGIPGLESNQVMENLGAFKNDLQSTAASRIPLLFEEDPDLDKSEPVPRVVELSPLQKTASKRKQPYTPPEEYAKEAKISKSDRFTEHFEGSDSPYNPEDLSPMDMGLTPSDVSNIQREALKGTVQLKLKDPFSGFENPTWQKILEAKSKHEAKRKRGKGNDSKNRSKEMISKGEAKLSKQDKLVNALVRQSKVEKECKEVLKLYYKSREITKEEYKNILRKAVPQVTMSNSPIIPEKIRSLMKKFVCKCKGQRLMSGHTHQEKKKKHRVRKTESVHHDLTFVGEKRFRYLNPDLPMPPV